MRLPPPALPSSLSAARGLTPQADRARDTCTRPTRRRGVPRARPGRRGVEQRAGETAAGPPGAGDPRPRRVQAGGVGRQATRFVALNKVNGLVRRRAVSTRRSASAPRSRATASSPISPAGWSGSAAGTTCSPSASPRPSAAACWPGPPWSGTRRSVLVHPRPGGPAAIVAADRSSADAGRSPSRRDPDADGPDEARRRTYCLPRLLRPVIEARPARRTRARCLSATSDAELPALLAAAARPTGASSSRPRQPGPPDGTLHRLRASDTRRSTGSRRRPRRSWPTTPSRSGSRPPAGRTRWTRTRFANNC